MYRLTVTPREVCGLDGTFLRSFGRADDGQFSALNDVALVVNAARFAPRGHPCAYVAENVTQELIEDGMTRAEKISCTAHDGRCYPFPNRQEDVRVSCTPGPCRPCSTTPMPRSSSSSSTRPISSL